MDYIESIQADDDLLLLKLIESKNEELTKHQNLAKSRSSQSSSSDISYGSHSKNISYGDESLQSLGIKENASDPNTLPFAPKDEITEIPTVKKPDEKEGSNQLLKSGASSSDSDGDEDDGVTNVTKTATCINNRKKSNIN